MSAAEVDGELVLAVDVWQQEGELGLTLPVRVRQGRDIGDLVRLYFSCFSNRGEESANERLWFQITDVFSDGDYAGYLCEWPKVMTTLSLGERLVFGPEHIVDWMPANTKWMARGLSEESWCE